MIWVVLIVALSMSVTAEDLSDYRLPENVKPLYYRLNLITDLENFKFSGEVWIHITCTNATSSIVLHSVDLAIGTSSVTVKEVGPDKSDGKSLKIVEQTAVPKHGFHIIKMDKMLKSEGSYIVYIPFNGTVESSLSGYYSSSYLDRGSNTTRWLALTQFEPSDARRAFPCFDEPGMKAKFTIRLAHKDTLSSVSNMPLLKTTPMENREGWSWDEFQESVPMSTYLVAWMVSDFGHGEAPTLPNNVKFRIWARPEALAHIGFASEVGPKVLEYFEKLFDVPYPLPKQDMAAIPDFSAGAMENWGLITYRETDLLYDPEAPSIHNKERVAYVVAHELAHQWFGNLVTMKWWSDLWLNEGFATYVGTLGVHNVLPEWNYLNEASLDYLKSVYELDSLKSSHPISIKVGPPSEVSQIFDAISYKKGSTVIRMMHNFLGDSFKTGVTSYLRTHAYNNAEQDDLWSALTEQAHKDKVLAPELTVKQIMDSWTLQTGYPLLTVKRDYEAGTAHISQTRFLREAPTAQDKSNQSCWWFPLTYTTESEANFNSTTTKQWLKCGEQQAQISDLKISKDEWLLVNLQLTGLARVMYDDKNWELLIKTLNSDSYSKIGALNRAGIILDVFDFAHRGDLSYKTALQLSTYLSRETEYMPLSRGLSSLSFLDLMLSRTPNYGIYRDYMKKILKPLYPRFGNLKETPEIMEELKIHNLLSPKFCAYELGDCADQAKELFEEWSEADLDEDNPIPPDQQPLILCSAVKYGSESTWNKVFNRYLASNSANEKSILLRAMGCTRVVWLLNRFLDWSIDEKSLIRKQDAISAFYYVAGHDNGFYVAWEFFEKNIKNIFKYHAPRANKVGSYLLSLSKKVMSEEELNRMKRMVDANSQYFEGAKLQVQQSLESATLNVKWHADNYKKVSHLLAA